MNQGFARLGGLTLAWHSDTSCAELGARFFEHLPASAHATPDLTIDLQRSDSQPDPALGGMPRSCHFDAVGGYGDGERLVVWDGHSAVTASSRERRVTALISDHSDPQALLGIVLFVPTAIALRALDAFHLHAAVVDVPGRGSVLLPGESGAGKTTLALCMVQLGARFISDDACFLHGEPGGSLGVSGWPRELHVAPRTLQAFPDLSAAAGGGVREGRDKRVVPLTAMSGRDTQPAAAPGRLVFPRVAGSGRSAVRPLDTTEALLRLIPPSALVALPRAPGQQRHMELLAALARSCPAVELELADDVLDEPKRLKTLLFDSAWTSAGGATCA